jgi:uncharacterized membrane protein YkoI
LEKTNMARVFLLPLIAAAGLAVGAPAFAQSVAMPAHPDINVAGFSGDPGALPAAISAIESATGGKVVEIRYNNTAGAPGYDVVVAKGTDISFERFTKPGQAIVAHTKETKPTWMLNWPAREDVSLVRTAKVGLPAAIRTAEAANRNAPAVAAGMATSAAGSDTEVKAYNIAIVQDGELRRVAVDSATGSVIADPGVLAAW